MQIQSHISGVNQKFSFTFEKKNPFTGQPLHEVGACDIMQVVQAIQGAQKAFSEWKNSSLEDRISLLERMKQVVSAKKKEFAELEALDQGLPLNFVFEHGIEASLNCLDSAISELSHHQTTDEASFSAAGVISLITSWNLSLRIIFERLAPALAAGNAVLIKVSSHSPVTAIVLQNIVLAAKIPEGLIQILIPHDAAAKDLLITHPAIKAVSFVGNLKNSSDILKKISHGSFNQFKKVQISSGSKNSAIALSEPEDSLFKKIMNSFMLGQGQLAWNSNRLFILEKFESQWVEKIKEYFSYLRPANDIYDSSAWGPCLRAESFSNFAEIENLAKKDQARLIQPPWEFTENQNTCFLRPTFTKDMSNCSTLQQDQVVAPLFILSVVKYPFDIAKYSNVSYYGQAAHIWSDESKIPKIAEQLEVALVCKNKWSVEIHQPLQGVKQSAYGLQDYRAFGAFFSNVKKMT